MDEELGGSASAQGPKRLFQVTQPPQYQPDPMRWVRVDPQGWEDPARRKSPAPAACPPKAFPRVLPGLGGLRRSWELSAGILAAGVL